MDQNLRKDQAMLDRMKAHTRSISNKLIFRQDEKNDDDVIAKAKAETLVPVSLYIRNVITNQIQYVPMRMNYTKFYDIGAELWPRFQDVEESYYDCSNVAHTYEMALKARSPRLGNVHIHCHGYYFPSGKSHSQILEDSNGKRYQLVRPTEPPCVKTYYVYCIMYVPLDKIAYIGMSSSMQFYGGSDKNNPRGYNRMSDHFRYCNIKGHKIPSQEKLHDFLKETPKNLPLMKQMGSNIQDYDAIFSHYKEKFEIFPICYFVDELSCRRGEEILIRLFIPYFNTYHCEEMPLKRVTVPLPKMHIPKPTNQMPDKIFVTKGGNEIPTHGDYFITDKNPLDIRNLCCKICGIKLKTLDERIAHISLHARYNFDSYSAVERYYALEAGRNLYYYGKITIRKDKRGKVIKTKEVPRVQLH